MFLEKVRSWPAAAVASLDNELFILQRSSSQLHVYDAISFTPRGSIVIPITFSAPNFVDMVSCSFYRRLYIANASVSRSCIVRLEIPRMHKEWKVDGLTSSTVISVTSSHHVLVFAGGGAKELKLFSTDGMLYNTVDLHPDLVNVNSAVEFMPGQYVVTHGRGFDVLHRVCVVNSDGEILHTFGGYRGSHPKLLDSSNGVAVDKDGFVYVDDEGNNRLIVLTQELNYLHCMPSVFTSPSNINFCRRMKVDKELGRIFVVHTTSTCSGNAYQTVCKVTIFEQC